mmetsp:Transcript_6700/g.16799  ORF Transcript_6700/g.16799 Transcript_6700/m.16799 type:complete len:509 (-) Transcript_6700:363-1889(-)
MEAAGAEKRVQPPSSNCQDVVLNLSVPPPQQCETVCVVCQEDQSDNKPLTQYCDCPASNRSTYFHESCLYQWALSKSTCGFCKAQYRIGWTQKVEQDFAKLLQKMAANIWCVPKFFISAVLYAGGEAKKEFLVRSLLLFFLLSNSLAGVMGNAPPLAPGEARIGYHPAKDFASYFLVDLYIVRILYEANLKQVEKGIILLFAGGVSSFQYLLPGVTLLKDTDPIWVLYCSAPFWKGPRYLLAAKLIAIHWWGEDLFSFTLIIPLSNIQSSMAHLFLITQAVLPVVARDWHWTGLICRFAASYVYAPKQGELVAWVIAPTYARYVLGLDRLFWKGCAPFAAGVLVFSYCRTHYIAFFALVLESIIMGSVWQAYSSVLLWGCLWVTGFDPKLVGISAVTGTVCSMTAFFASDLHPVTAALLSVLPYSRLYFAAVYAYTQVMPLLPSISKMQQARQAYTHPEVDIVSNVPATLHDFFSDTPRSMDVTFEALKVASQLLHDRHHSSQLTARN